MQPKTQCIPGSAGDVIDSLLFIGLQGVYGPYGGDGGEDFASERPGKCFTEIIIFICWTEETRLTYRVFDDKLLAILGCYMEFISGSAGDRLDSLSFHYVCP